MEKRAFAVQTNKSQHSQRATGTKVRDFSFGKIVIKIRTTIGIAIALVIVVVTETVASNANSNLVATAKVIVAVAVLVLVCVQGLNSFKGLDLERDRDTCRPSM